MIYKFYSRIKFQQVKSKGWSEVDVLSLFFTNVFATAILTSWDLRLYSKTSLTLTLIECDIEIVLFLISETVLY